MTQPIRPPALFVSIRRILVRVDKSFLVAEVYEVLSIMFRAASENQDKTVIVFTYD